MAGKRKEPVPTDEAKFMDKETHPWLQWTGASRPRRVVLNNKLASIQKKSFNQPRFMDWALVRELGIETKLNELFMTRGVRSGRGDSVLDIPIWKRVFTIRERIYREWCLEFYSSFCVDKKFQDLQTDEVIHFRLGGLERHYTLPQFGKLLGLFTQAELDSNVMSDYLVQGDRSSSEFVKGINECWYSISGKAKHSSTESKLSDLRFPLLRFLSKMITHAFFQRTTHNDKVYAEDLWLLSYFHEHSPTRFVNVVWALACFMEKNGVGKQHTSQIVCGHFVTRIVRSLELDTQANIDACSPGMEMRAITRLELETSEIVDRTTRMLMVDGERPPPRTEERKVGLRDIMSMLQRQEEHHRETMAMIVGQNRHILYHIRRYQPYLERFAKEKEIEYDLPLPPYAPPDLVMPMPRGEGGSTSRVAEEDVDDDDGSDDSGDDDADEEDVVGDV